MVNAAASLPTGSDPICGTCDIQATVRAPRRINIGLLLEASRQRRRICHRVFARAIVIACEENLSRGGLARLLACPHLN
jgi:hypothetical protein